jgi:hypothetical protein
MEAIIVDSKEAIGGIMEGEAGIRSVWCRYRCSEAAPNSYSHVGEWGYEGGKEFISRAITGGGRTRRAVNAFDGKAWWGLSYTMPDGPSCGSCTPGHRLDLFTGPETPRMLLGWALCHQRDYRLGEILSGGHCSHMRAEMTRLDGRECILVEALHCRVPEFRTPYDFKVWVDAGRGYRLLQLEMYHSPGYGRSAYSKEWQSLITRICVKELRQVDGIWFPLAGESHSYDYVPEAVANGMSWEEVEALYKKRFAGMSEEEMAGLVKLVRIPLGPSRSLEVADLELNKDIAPERFRVQFPEGCEVCDLVEQGRYTAGANGERLDIRELPPKAEPGETCCSCG